MELLEEKHLIYFDSKRQYAASYTFALKAPLETAGGLPQGTATQDGLEEGEGVNTANFNEAREVSTLDTEISFQIRVKDEERLEWVSEYYAMQVQSRKKEYGGMPFSL